MFPEIKKKGKQIAPERFLCKWCGYCYAHPYGLIQAEPNADKGYWDKRGDIPRFYTPKEMADLPSADRAVKVQVV